MTFASVVSDFGKSKIRTKQSGVIALFLKGRFLILFLTLLFSYYF